MRAFAGDERGIILVMFALLLPVMVAFIGLGVEIGLWFSQKRNLQAAADAAALAAAYEVAEGRPSGVTTIATREATNNGWSSSDGSITVNYQYPASGAYTTDDNAVEVLLTRQVNPMFIGYFIDSAVTINARAVATTALGTGTACVLALADGDPGQAVKTSGATTNVTMTGCSIAVNSTNSQALKNTSGTLSADCIYIEGAGGYTGSPTTTQCSAPKSGQPAAVDPYKDIPEPTDELELPCDGDHDDWKQTSGSGSLTEGTYCGGIEVTGGNLTLASGLYIMDDGNFKITGGANVSGTDVTIVLMDSSGNNSCGIFEISGGGSFNMTAPSTGTYAGILVFRHTTCSSTQGDMKFVGGSSSTIVGVIYSPSKEVKVSGGSSVSGSCLQIVADTVEFSGSGTLGNDCDNTGVKDILVGGYGLLVE